MGMGGGARPQGQGQTGKGAQAGRKSQRARKTKQKRLAHSPGCTTHEDGTPAASHLVLGGE